MQHDLERSIRAGIPVSSSRLAQLIEVEGEQQASPVSHNSVHGLDSFLHTTQSQTEQSQIRRTRPSLTTWHLTLVIGDSVLLVTSLLLLRAFIWRSTVETVAAGQQDSLWSIGLLWIFVPLAAWGFAASIARAQDMTNASNRLRTLLSLLFALVLMLCFCLAVTSPFLVTHPAWYQKMVVFFLLITMPMLGIWRILFAEIINIPCFRCQAVVVGANPSGENLARELRRAKRPLANVVGYISENSEEVTQGRDGLPVLGGHRSLHQIMQGGMVDILIMAIDYKVNPALFQDALQATQFGISVLPMAMVYEWTSGKIPLEHTGEQWYTTLPSGYPASVIYLAWRRIIDIAVGLLGSLLLLIFLPIIALFIYLDSPGQIFYRQERLGYQGRIFSMLKFRSMRPDAERMGHALWAAQDDWRVTRVGHFLRATHLDELPQVFNILSGDMSVTGPRPEREQFVKQLEKIIPFYRCRLSVKPGLTGWAQVKYPYTNTQQDALAKLQYDLYYIKNQSFTLDVFIIVKTIIEVALCRGQ